MSIRFTCTACHTVLKIGEAISEPRKVRCTECGIVILLTPDEDSPTGVVASVPEQPDKTVRKSKAAMARQRNMLLGGLGVLALLAALGLWWMLSGPSDRGAVEGEVLLNGTPLDKGTILFKSFDPANQVTTSAPIIDGRYKIAASKGPAVGMNLVEIRGERKTGRLIANPKGDPGEMIDEVVEAVAAHFHSPTKLQFEVKRGSNTADFTVTAN
jgi:DNA-directed RNA polymerase subunit RPC12/RpoP